MKVNRKVDVGTLVKQFLGSEVLPGVEPWRSRLRALSKAITFVESDSAFAPELLAHPAFDGLTLQSRVIGLTGLPGAGKSSLASQMVTLWRASGRTVAILAIDPASQASGGAVLGDRIRMQDHFNDSGVYIRSMSNRGALGGVARATRSAIRLASLIGFDYILVETVGVGQSESQIVNIADTTVLVLMPNSGDEVQLMKAGILQLANVYVVNKSDIADPSRMLMEIHENTAPANSTEWCPPALRTSALQHSGVEQLIEAIDAHGAYEKQHPQGQANKLARVKREILEDALFILEQTLQGEVDLLPTHILETLVCGERPVMALAQELAERYLKPPKEPL